MCLIILRFVNDVSKSHGYLCILVFDLSKKTILLCEKVREHANNVVDFEAISEFIWRIFCIEMHDVVRLYLKIEKYEKSIVFEMCN